MSLETSLSELEELLIAERKAIRACDVDAVLAAAERKEALFEEIKAASGSLHLHRARFVSISAELRRNGVLLAHARDCTRDVLSLASNAGRHDAPRVGRLLSAKG